MFTDAYKYREVENGIFYEVEGRVIVRIFLSFLFKMNAQMLHTHMTFYGFCTCLALKVSMFPFQRLEFRVVNVQSRTYFCILGAFSNSQMTNPSPHPTINVGRVYPGTFSKL